MVKQRMQMTLSLVRCMKNMKNLLQLTISQFMGWNPRKKRNTEVIAG